MKRLLLLLSFLWLIFSIPKAQTLYPRLTLLDDIDTLYATISDIHPDMFANMPQDEFEKRLIQSKLLVKDSMTRLGFYKIITPLISALGDGHTAVYFPYDELNWPSIRLFPVTVEVHYKDSSAIAKESHVVQQKSIPHESRILSINGKETREIIGEMLQYVSGETIFYRASRLNKRFAPLLYLLYGDSSFAIEYLYDNIVSKIFVDGISYSELTQSERRNQKNEPDHTFSVNTETSIALMRFNSFEDFPVLCSFIDSAFKVILEEKIENLIIDIRKNGGGDSRVADELFQYISPVPYRQEGKLTEKRGTRLRKYFEEKFGYTFDDTSVMKYFTEVPLIKLRENPLRYNGKTWLLTSHSTFSAAADLAWAFKYFNMGTVVGEETGGMAVCFGAVIPLKLPHTEIEFGVSYKHFYNYGANDENRHGTIPDHEVPEADALDYVFEMIGKGGSNKTSLPE